MNSILSQVVTPAQAGVQRFSLTSCVQDGCDREGIQRCAPSPVRRGGVYPRPILNATWY
jgi:hypothetical protein